MSWEVIQGDCLETLRGMEDNLVDSIVTDPPYGLSNHKPGEVAAIIENWIHGRDWNPGTKKGFMGKSWDAFVPGPEVWRECLRVLKPGGHMCVFAGSRTVDLMGLAVRLAGFEIRDQLQWIYGSGFPKSLDVSKAIDKAAGAERVVVGVNPNHRPISGVEYVGKYSGANTGAPDITAPATEAAKQWDGWGTALKPSAEPVILARKPLSSDQFCDSVSVNLLQLEARLWLILSALTAKSDSASNPQGLSEAALSIAGWSADETTHTLEDLSALMDMSQLESGLRSSLSTVSSWRSTLEEALRHGSTSTTSTESSPTTDWKILSFCLSRITPRSITMDAIGQNGESADAGNAVRYFGAEMSRLSATLTLSALDPAISWAQERSLGVEGPAHEPIILARKPLIGTVAANVLEHGTGGINVDGCRVGTDVIRQHGRGAGQSQSMSGPNQAQPAGEPYSGRWPANIILDEEAGALLDAQSGVSKSTGGLTPGKGGGGHTSGHYGKKLGANAGGLGDSGGASRFFYCAKASRKEREAGLEDFEPQRRTDGRESDIENPRLRTSERLNVHPTVKPLSLMRWLVRLITPPGGLVLDPFNGSGSTGCAAVAEGFSYVGCELSPEYVAIAEARITHWEPKPFDPCADREERDDAQAELFDD